MSPPAPNKQPQCTNTTRRLGPGFAVLLISLLASANASASQRTPLTLLPGFQAELVYEVPAQQGSWVALTPDPKGRLITSDQFGNLYRLTPSKPTTPPKVEQLNIEADSAQLQQVFLNIYMNASDAIEETGVITTVTRPAGDDSIQIEISDTGKGLTTESIDKIFNPFFTTKSKGSGLGLSISKRLIEQHGGTIEAHSSPGAGTCFVIKLPLKQ